MFDQGRIVETGTFDELVARRAARFAELAQAQFLTAEPAPVASPELAAAK